MDSQPRNGVEEAIEAAGGVNALAALCGITPSAVSQWRAAGFVPAHDGRALDVHRLTGVALHRLNPTVYPAPVVPPVPPSLAAAH